MLSIRSRICSATSAASSSVMPGSTTQNSSPPTRPAISFAPRVLAISPAAWVNTLSPAWCPNRSLMLLKQSRSIWMTEKGSDCCSHCFASLFACSNSDPRLFSRVRGSCQACHCSEFCIEYILLTMRRITSHEMSSIAVNSAQSNASTMLMLPKSPRTPSSRVCTRRTTPSKWSRRSQLTKRLPRRTPPSESDSIACAICANSRGSK